MWYNPVSHPNQTPYVEVDNIEGTTMRLTKLSNLNLINLFLY